MVDDGADDFGTPALGEDWEFAVFEAAEVEAVGDEVADVLGRSSQAGGDLSGAADAAEGGAEELTEQIELRAGAFAFEARQLVVFEGEDFFNALRQPRQVALDIAAFHAADGSDAFLVGGLALGDFDEQVVAEDAADRLIAALG